MKVINLLILSTFILVGLYLGIYSLLYKQKVKEAQNETSILTPPRLFHFLDASIILSFLSTSLCILILLYELFVG